MDGVSEGTVEDSIPKLYGNTNIKSQVMCLYLLGLSEK